MKGIVQTDVMEGAALAAEGIVGIGDTRCPSGGIDDEAGGIISVVGLRGRPAALLSLPLEGGEYCVGAEAAFVIGTEVVGAIGGMALVCADASWLMRINACCTSRALAGRSHSFCATRC